MQKKEEQKEEEKKEHSQSQDICITFPPQTPLK